MLDLDAELEEYIGLHSEPEPEILQQLSRATHQKILRPRMLSGNLQGQFLKMLCRMNRVQRVLEIGTFTGYAAISMAMGMGEKACSIPSTSMTRLKILRVIISNVADWPDRSFFISEMPVR